MLAPRRLEILQTFGEGAFDSLDVISAIIRGRRGPQTTDCKSSNGHGRDHRAFDRELAHGWFLVSPFEQRPKHRSPLLGDGEPAGDIAFEQPSDHQGW